MTVAKITKTVEIELDIDTAAQWFSEISDDDMAQFFCAAADKMKQWSGCPSATITAQMMWCYVGEHLAKCECSTEDGRAMIRDIAYFMENALKKDVA